MIKKIFPLVLLPLAACASIVDGSQQQIAVKTHPVNGAECDLKNTKGNWFIPSTPGTATIKQANGPLTVVCEKSNYKGSATTESSTKGAAFGNILAGGIIGGAVDMSTGAAYKYPAEVVVKMTKE